MSVWSFPISFFKKRSWSLPEIIEEFEPSAKEIRVDVENNDLIIEVIIDENIKRKFREHQVGVVRVFYED